MRFNKLYVKNFRNFNEEVFQFSEGLNIFIGQNGQGKTNALEALYLICKGKSFRYSENINLIQENANEAYIKAAVTYKDLDFTIQSRILRSKKEFLLNQKKISHTEIAKKFSCVLFSPESLSAIKEGDDLRRGLLDDLCVLLNPRFEDVIADFRKCLKSRNKVLKSLQEEKTLEAMNVLESLNSLFLGLATQLTVERIQALSKISGEFNNAMQYISDNKNVEISVDYQISGQKTDEKSIGNVAEIIKKRMFELKDAEIAYGSSLVGPQKHDVTFLYNQNDSRFYCSQGQQRAMILSFKMAQIVYHMKAFGVYPILMLDDVLSELDLNKREKLILFLKDINTQIFLTTTDLSISKNILLEKEFENIFLNRFVDGKMSSTEKIQTELERYF